MLSKRESTLVLFHVIYHVKQDNISFCFYRQIEKSAFTPLSQEEVESD